MQCSDGKNTALPHVGTFSVEPNELSLDVTNAVIARIVFSACWNIVETLCGASGKFLLLSIVCSGGENTVSHVGTFPE